MGNMIATIFENGVAIPLFEKNHKLVSEENKDMTAKAKYILQNPWQGRCGDYNVKYKEDKDNFLCSYHCIHFDTLDIKVFGRGRTAREAEADCANNLQRIADMQFAS